MRVSNLLLFFTPSQPGQLYQGDEVERNNKAERKKEKIKEHGRDNNKKRASVYQQSRVRVRELVLGF